MSSTNITKNEQELGRLMEELNIKTQSELANRLGYTSVSAISNWKKKGNDWNRVLSKFSSLDLNYVKTGERSESTSRREQDKRAIEHSWGRLKDAVNESGIPYEARDQMISRIRDRAKILSEDLEYFSDLIDRLNQIDE